MAKGDRNFIAFVCSVCKNQNYISEKNKTNTPDKLLLHKYCNICMKVTEHKESTNFK